MKNNVHLIERGSNCFAITNIAFNKFRVWIDPVGFAPAMRVRLQIIEHSHPPAFAHEKISDMRSDQTGAARNKSVLSIPGHRNQNRLVAVSSARNFRVWGATLL